MQFYIIAFNSQNIKKIISLNFSSIKNIIFDLGGVIINIDPKRTYNAFAKLSNSDLESSVAKFQELKVFEKYEAGEFTNSEFRNFLKSALNLSQSDFEIDQAWNELLLDIPPERIELIQKLRDKYKLYLLSNTNNIHIIGVNQILQESTGIPHLNHLFDKVYLSYEMKQSKPYVEIYERVLNEQGLVASETLFIDDNKDNIEGAKLAGLQTIFVESPFTILELLKNA